MLVSMISPILHCFGLTYMRVWVVIGLLPMDIE